MSQFTVNDLVDVVPPKPGEAKKLKAPPTRFKSLEEDVKSWWNKTTPKDITSMRKLDGLMAKSGWYDNVSDTELDAIRKWMSEDFELMAGYMRGTLINVNDDVIDAAFAVGDALEKAPLIPKGTTLYRGMSTQGTGILDDALKSGASFRDQSFVSTSSVRSVATNMAAEEALVELRVVGADVRGGFLDGLVETLNEAEVLLPEALQFKVRSVKTLKSGIKQYKVDVYGTYEEIP